MATTKGAADSNWTKRVLSKIDAEKERRGPKTYYLRGDLVEALDKFSTKRKKKASTVLEAILEEFLNSVGDGK